MDNSPPKLYLVARNIIAKLFLAGLSVFLFLVLLEFSLRAGYLDNINRINPAWIPDKFKKINEEIN